MELENVNANGGVRVADECEFDVRRAVRVSRVRWR
jgi:hypothetical protein